MLVTVYAPPEALALEITTIFDVLDAANRLVVSKPRYKVRLIADGTGVIATRSGLRIVPDADIGNEGIAEADEPGGVLIVAAAGSWRVPPPAPVIAWLRAQARTAGRYGAVGNGAFALGAAGLLDGRRVTTHWSCSDELARRFPTAEVAAGLLHVRDGALFSSAGGMAAIDLLLDLVEEDHGRDLALELARRLVVFMKRSGAQAQLSLSLATQTTTRDPIQRVLGHVRDHPTGDLSITALAAIAAMSPRNFTRVFVQETGMRPGVFVERLRVNLAKRMLDESALSPQQVARLTGFSGTEAARRAFRRQTGKTLSRYRAARGGGDADE